MRNSRYKRTIAEAIGTPTPTPTPGVPSALILTQTSADGTAPFNWTIEIVDDSIAAGQFLRTQTSADGLKNPDGTFTNPTQDLEQMLEPADFADSDLDGFPDMTVDGFTTPSGTFELIQWVEEDDELGTIMGLMSNTIGDTIIEAAAKLFDTTGFNKDNAVLVDPSTLLTATATANTNAARFARATLEAVTDKWHAEFEIATMDAVTSPRNGNINIAVCGNVQNFDTVGTNPGASSNEGMTLVGKIGSGFLTAYRNGGTQSLTLPGGATVAVGDIVILEGNRLTNVVDVYYYDLSAGTSSLIGSITLTGVYIPADWYVACGGFSGHLAAPNKDGVTFNPGSSPFIRTPSSGYSYYA